MELNEYEIEILSKMVQVNNKQRINSGFDATKYKYTCA